MNFIYGALATGCGYTPKIIDEMTLFEARRIFSYWEDHPPAHLILAARYGLTRKNYKNSVSSISEAGISIDDLRTRYPNGIIN